ncbi:alpha/beta hydrolase [Roseococcus sp. SDR]|uniref:alpha/beta fold hydrolase n=1 Tax=Roseococcus sp. SDR TaxID=2835532 RepID=UPI001BD0888A|nr:alpha/beta fold hydrolase [Roseococcus sp. SDR]MBS7789465.1 alpha/beta fold hydrolase [Roseococcus sp. SDR]MBV1844779.1 alpha/beta hydrolase [Roseococcus sp. SDR]
MTRPDGAELAVTITGEGPGLLLVSGLGGTAGFWSRIVPVLAASFRVAVLDQRGVGASTRGTAPVTITTLAEDAAAVATELGGRFALCGHSTGAAIVLTMAAGRMCDVSRIVLSAGWLQPDPYLRALFTTRLAILERAGYAAYEQMGRFLGYPAETLVAAGNFATPDRLPEGREVEERQRWSERIGALLDFNGTDLPPCVSVPTLVVGTPDDLIVPHHHQRATAEAIPGAAFAPLSDGGHFYPQTRQAAFLDRVLPFLSV